MEIFLSIAPIVLMVLAIVVIYTVQNTQYKKTDYYLSNIGPKHCMLATEGHRKTYFIIQFYRTKGT